MKFRLYLIIAVLILTYPSTAFAKTKKISVSTQDELFTAISQQILNHKSQEFYYISTDELKQQITVNKDFQEPFSNHYNPKAPLMSGCYTHFAISDYNISWFIGQDRTLSVLMHYYVPGDTSDDYYNEMRTLAEELKGDDDYESVKAVHDYIIKRVEYDQNSIGTNYTDIEGFRENRMVCQGYSMASYVLLSYMGIPVRIVTGTAGSNGRSEPHAWNIVQVDGKWYNYDATWDDAGGDKVIYDYFLKGKNDFPYHLAEGIYANSDFTNVISEQSYFTTFQFRDNIITALSSLIFPVLAVLVIYCYFRLKKKSSMVPDYPTIGRVIEDDFESYKFKEE